MPSKDMTRIAAALLGLKLKSGINPMRKPKTYFEQIPVEVVKQIAEEIDSDQMDSDDEETRNKNVTVETPATKTEPYSVGMGMQCRNPIS